MISLEKWEILKPLQKLPKTVVELGKLIMPKALKSCPKSNKSPNLVTLLASYIVITQNLLMQLLTLKNLITFVIK